MDPELPFTLWLDEVQQLADLREQEYPSMEECSDFWEDGFDPVEFLDHVSGL